MNIMIVILFFVQNPEFFRGNHCHPFLFSMFMNDINEKISTAEDVGINIDNCLLSIILFADDMVIFSRSRHGLQNGLNCLNDYCDRWGLTVNVDKTKCVAFKNGGRIAMTDNSPRALSQIYRRTWKKNAQG